MVIESCEYKHRAQIGSLLLASMPIFGIILGVIYFFLLDWRHMQLLGKTFFLRIIKLNLSSVLFRYTYFYINTLLSMVEKTNRPFFSSV